MVLDVVWLLIKNKFCCFICCIIIVIVFLEVVNLLFMWLFMLIVNGMEFNVLLNVWLIFLGIMCGVIVFGFSDLLDWVVMGKCSMILWD